MPIIFGFTFPPVQTFAWLNAMEVNVWRHRNGNNDIAISIFGSEGRSLVTGSQTT